MTLSANWLQNVDYAARLDRLTIAGMFGTEGKLGPASMKVTGNAGSLSVDISPGWAVVQGDDQTHQGMYLCYNDASANLALSAPGSNSWIVGICLQVRDPNATGPAGDDAQFVAVYGTASASPTKPAIPDSHLVLEWVVVESGDTLGTQCVFSLNRVQSGGNVPTGVVVPFAALPIAFGPLESAVPNGWLLCSGQAVSRTTYADLFHLIGTTYGAGDGSTTFNVPDLRGRMILGNDNMGGTSANRVTDTAADGLGGTDGSATVALTEAQLASHDHSISGGSHSHTASSATGGGHSHGGFTGYDGDHNHGPALGSSFVVGGYDGGWDLNTSGVLPVGGANTDTESTHRHIINADSGHTHTITVNSSASHSHTIGNAGSGQAHDNMPPYMAMPFIIKA